MSSFETFQVVADLPASLHGRTSIPLPPTDACFYPAVNSYTFPCPLDTDRLRGSLSKTLNVFPFHCGVIGRDQNNHALSIKLVNRPVNLTVGATDHPGPFAENWTGEKHPDYFEELERGNYSSTEGAPLCKIKVTTWKKTGQTNIFVSQSYALGDASAILLFVKTWSAIYQGKEPSVYPTFEKHFLPTPQIPPRSSHAVDIAPLSSMTVDFDEEFFKRRDRLIHEQTVRLDFDLPAEFVDHVWTTVKEELHLNNPRVSRSDAFQGYLITMLQESCDEPVEILQQLVTMRGRTMTYNGQDFTFPMSVQGNAYMIWSSHITTPIGEQSPGSHAQALFHARKIFADKARIGRAYSFYYSFYEKAISRNRMLIDSGFPDAIAINWLVNVELNDPDFGFPLQTGHIEWESLEKFVQVWRANPLKQADGTWRRDPEGLHVLLRLRPDDACQFLERIQNHMDRLLLSQSYSTSPASLLRRVQVLLSQKHGQVSGLQARAKL